MSAERPRWLVPAFVLALGLALAFSGDAVWRVAHLGEADMPVKGWMTPRLVVETYGIDAAVLAGILGNADPGQTLTEIAAVRGMAPDALVAAVQAVVR